uniref:Platelet-derived growth factor subunit B n=2 Tax=Cyprinus carpio TaxID=7962 RepID=A0A8C1DN21_CYPCA
MHAEQALSGINLFQREKRGDLVKCFSRSSFASVCISASLSADAQPAQQAICKVRTEVIEVTRSMLDRSNANFLLWPPCVEVQRCSGCCNTKSLQCVPVLTHTRYLQVMKIQYVNKQPLYDKAVVSVLDHVECRCQPAPRPAQRRKSSGHKQEGIMVTMQLLVTIDFHSMEKSTVCCPTIFKISSFVFNRKKKKPHTGTGLRVSK